MFLSQENDVQLASGGVGFCKDNELFEIKARSRIELMGKNGARNDP